MLLRLRFMITGAGLTAWMCKMLFTYGWSWWVCLVFGAIMSATDPVAVVALLKDIGASERLGTMMEGESLFNDGTAIVLFNIMLALAKVRWCCDRVLWLCAVAAHCLL